MQEVQQRVFAELLARYQLDLTEVELFNLIASPRGLSVHLCRGPECYVYALHCPPQLRDNIMAAWSDEKALYTGPAPAAEGG